MMKWYSALIVASLALLFTSTSAFGATAGAGSKSQYAATRAAVYAIFGPYADQAISVVKCETGGTYSPWAKNGQYLGTFQMGSHERATYGDGNDVWTQARAAYVYFIVSGRDWSPWTCKP